MKANYTNKTPQTTSEITLGNLYEINQQLMQHEPALKKEEIQQKLDKVYSWIITSTTQYYMLLCHDARDYTLFNLNKYHTPFHNKEPGAARAIVDLEECLTNRGEILAIELQEAGGWEIWIRNERGSFAYYLFAYDDAVLEY